MIHMDLCLSFTNYRVILNIKKPKGKKIQLSNYWQRGFKCLCVCIMCVYVYRYIDRERERKRECEFVCLRQLSPCACMCVVLCYFLHMNCLSTLATVWDLLSLKLCIVTALGANPAVTPLRCLLPIFPLGQPRNTSNLLSEAKPRAFTAGLHHQTTHEPPSLPSSP